MEVSPSYLVIKHQVFPLNSPHPGEPGYDPNYAIPCPKVLGGGRDRKKAFRPSSIVNISGMSFGSLSAPAVQALNKGAALAHCLQNTGEGGVSVHHLCGGDLVWQIGTGYFGCRDESGRFSMARLKEGAERYPSVRAIEIKLSQGAKPGVGGFLPGRKVTPEIAAARGIPFNQDCASPGAHREFHDADSLLDFAEAIADETGLPVGIKSAVGELAFWKDLARQMSTGRRAVDFIMIDGGEGGTGAGPLVFTDHVALPFKMAFSRVHRVFDAAGVSEKVVFVGSGKLGFSQDALLAFAMGCDMINVAREAMFAIGCTQAQRCHTNHCPTGVATQNRWLAGGLDPNLKSVRVASYITALRKDLLSLARACGVPHPGQVRSDQLEFLDDRFGAQTVAEVFGRRVTWPTSEHPSTPRRDQPTQDETSPASRPTSVVR